MSLQKLLVLLSRIFKFQVSKMKKYTLVIVLSTHFIQVVSSKNTTWL